MKDFINQVWLPIAGSASSISFKGISTAIHQDSLDIVNSIPDIIVATDPLIHYFWIGVYGALGGLLVKIIWGLLKKYIPILEMDKKKNSKL